MRVAIIEPVGGHGGMDYYDYGLSYGLGENNCQVFYYTCNKTQLRVYKNVETVITFVDVWNNSLPLKVYRYLSGFNKALNNARKQGVKIVHLHFFTFRLIDLIILKKAKSMGFKIVATVHDVNAFDKSSSSSIEQKCYNQLDGIIVHNQSSFDDLRKKDLPMKKCVIIPHGNYKPFIQEIKSRVIINSAFTLLFFGQIKKVKGLDILLDAIYRTKQKGYNIRLIIAGKAWKDDLVDYENKINILSLKEDVETHFHYIPDQEVASFYERADLVVLPYTEIYQSGVLLLTMSYGKPVLTSDLEAFKEIISDGISGFVFKNKDSEALSNKIIEIINSRDTLTSVVAQAKHIIDTDYDWIMIGRKTKEFYKLIE